MGVIAGCAVALLVMGAEGAQGIESLVPTGQLKVEVMQLAGPEPYPTLIARFLRAAREHGPWLLEWTKQAGPGPLPWHPKMGLSRAEYERLLALQSQLRYQPEREAVISVRRSDGWLVMDGGDALPDLWEVMLNPAARSLRSPLGDCPSFKTIVASVKQKATGPWQGYTCSQITGEPGKGDFTSVVFHLGRLVESRKVFLSFQAKRLRGAGPLERLDVVLRYATP